MPKGMNLSQAYRQLIVQKFSNGFSADQIYVDVFSANDQIISLKHLKSICCNLRENIDFHNVFLCRPLPLPGCPLKINPAESHALILFAHTSRLRIKPMKNSFVNYYHHANNDNNNEPQPYSNSTFLRTLHRNRYSLKQAEHRHLLCDDFLGLQFLDRISHLDVFKLVDIDEMSSSPETFYLKYGWSPIGDACK